MARYSRYDQDRASTPGFPRQSDPAGQPATSQGAARHASHAASGHHAEILDFESISARRGANEAAQNASFSSFVSSRTRQTAGESGNRHHQAEHSVKSVSSETAASGRSHERQPEHKAPTGSFFSFFERFASSKQDSSKRAAASTGKRSQVSPEERSRSRRAASGKAAKSRRLLFNLSFDWFRSSRPAQVSALVCACLILGCAFVYPSAKDAYTAVRNTEQAQAEYQAVLNRNNEIQSRIDTLKTDEGIEDLARNSYGYVMSGEHSVRVSGLGDQSIAADAENQTPAIAAGSVAPPETWYSPVLDVIFGYTPDNATTTADDSSSSSDDNQ